MKKLVILLLALAVISCTQATSRLSSGDKSDAADFVPKQIRYLSPFDILRTLKEVFPGAEKQVDESCKHMTDDLRGILGDYSAASGSPIFKEPNAGFVRWYVKCVNDYSLRFKYIDKATFLGATIAEKLKTNSSAAYERFLDLTPSDQLQVITDQIERLIGPSEIVADRGLVKDSNELAQLILDSLEDKTAAVETITSEIILKVALRDEFLSY